jgi:aminopeptidase N
MIRLLIVQILLFLSVCCKAQLSDLLPTKEDSTRGSITAERAWWDVTHYAVTVEPHYLSKTLRGTNELTFKTTARGKRMQIDLQEPMQIYAITCDGRAVSFSRNGNAYYINFPEDLPKGVIRKITIQYGGKPREAVNPPWDGGWIWKQDSYGNPWMTVACQGLGASVWYPCKDHQSDEPDSATLSIIVPDSLVAVGNGQLRSMLRKGNKSNYTWAVVNPINNYNIVPYIGRYVNWSDSFNGEKGKLHIGYWVLQENEMRARKQFAQVPAMLKCFEHWFGPYPFYQDGYKLVESPHLGMEHQSAIAYGNGFANGYLGKDLSGSGWGEKWDFIIVHESGHEWFGNSITATDLADMWVHEGFTNYSEVIFTGCEYGIEAANEYVQGLRKNIQNDKPLIAQYGVNREGSIDMYYKGSNLVHMIRQLINDDEKFRRLLRSMNKDFFHQTVTSARIEKYISEAVGRDLTRVFDQYLRTTEIPVLEYSIRGTKLRYRWINSVNNFDMPLRIQAGKDKWIFPTTQWKETEINSTSISIDPNFYIGSRQL